MQAATRKRNSWVAVLALLGVLLAGCADEESGTTTDDTTTDDTAGDTDETASTPFGTTSGPADLDTPAAGGRLVFGIEAEPEGLDPTRYAFGASGHFVASAVMEPLATLDENSEPVPYLAESIEPNDDSTVWTITIPSGVTFHDGTALTADVVVQNLDAYRESYITKAGLVGVETIEATDDTTVVVTLADPFVSFDAALATQFGYIIAPAMLEDPAVPIGTGPYVFEEHIANESWTFTANPDYRREDRPYLDSIEFRPIVDNVARQEALEEGDVDLILTRVPEVIASLRESEFKLVENAAGEEDFMIFNTEAPPFDNLLARQAVAYATDTERWLDELGGGDIHAPANGPFAPGQPGYLEDNGYPEFDLEKAKELVAQYEEETGEPLAFTMKTQADTAVLQESQLEEEMWEAAGMDVTVETMAQINLIAQIATANFEMGRFRLFNMPNADVDANTFWRSSSILPPPDISLNFPRFGSDVVDEAVATAVGTTDVAVRDEAYQAINREFAEQIPYLWLARPVWMLAANERVNGVYAGANGTVQTIGGKTWLTDVWIAQ